ncbi:MAG TPA: hypothetical protein VGM39_24820 [Kofleriaceae bacterium]|jgi:hypothetical protein
MRSVLVALLLSIAACGGSSQNAAPATPTEAPPLPPASGTPIGILVDESGSLHLRDDQVSQLRDIDEQLSARNDAIDSQLAERGAPVGGDAPASSGGGGGRRGGGRRGGMGGMGGGGSGGMGGGGRHHRGGGGAPPGGGDPSQHKPSAASQNELHEQRMANTKDAMARAFALLDPDQQATARKLLTDRGMDLTGAPPAPGSDANAPRPLPSSAESDGHAMPADEPAEPMPAGEP